MTGKPISVFSKTLAMWKVSTTTMSTVSREALLWKAMAEEPVTATNKLCA